MERCQAVAGLSLGEYTALAVAGVFDFETGLKVVKLRGEAMQVKLGGKTWDFFVGEKNSRER